MATGFGGWKDTEDLGAYLCLHCCRKMVSIIGEHDVTTYLFIVYEREDSMRY